MGSHGNGRAYLGKYLQSEKKGPKAEPLKSSRGGPGTSDRGGTARELGRKPGKCGVWKSEEECSLSKERSYHLI